MRRRAKSSNGSLINAAALKKVPACPEKHASPAAAQRALFVLSAFGNRHSTQRFYESLICDSERKLTLVKSLCSTGTFLVKWELSYVLVAGRILIFVRA